IRELQRRWDGGMERHLRNGLAVLGRPDRQTKPLRLTAVMITCPERAELRRRTLENLLRTDFGETPVEIQVADSKGDDKRRTQTRCAFLALQRGLEKGGDYILFLEDDLDFNRHLAHNLRNWQPLARGVVTLASL